MNLISKTALLEIQKTERQVIFDTCLLFLILETHRLIGGLKCRKSSVHLSRGVQEKTGAETFILAGFSTEDRKIENQKNAGQLRKGVTIG